MANELIEEATTKNIKADKSKDVVTTTSFEDASSAIANLVQSANLNVNIYSPSLFPRIFNTNVVLEACQVFALMRAQNKINILIDEAAHLHQVDHKLLRLSQRCSSRIFIKMVNPEIPKRGDEFVAIDKNGYFHRPSTGHAEAHCCSDNPQKTADFLRFFHEAWALSASDPNLRSMLL